jgi:hypothetical protein
MKETFEVADLRRHLLAGPMTWRFCWGEFCELAEAVRELDVPHIREEWNDVWFCLWGLLGQATPRVLGWTIPQGLGHSSCVKFAARLDVWVEICAKHGTELRMETLKGGSNFRKRTKVSRILKAHGVEDVQWDWLSDLVGGFELEG